MVDVGPLYARGRERIAGLVHDLDPERASTSVPPCPGWTVHDVVAHLSGICADIVGGRTEGVATDPWTARQVEERADWSIGKILEEWTEMAPQCEAMAHLFPDDADVQWLTDQTTHEHDIRCALGRPGSRDDEVVAIGLNWLVGALAGDATPFRILTPEGDDIVMGTGDPLATVRCSRFEMLRALTGRRSEDQIAVFDWDADYRPYLGAFSRGPFRMAQAPVAE